jgi:hypothetical protein
MGGVEVMLIAVTGYKNSGKNAVSNVLAEHYKFKITGFADALKGQMLAIDPWILMDDGKDVRIERLSIIVAAIGWDRAKEKFPEIRRLLQKGGTEGGRAVFGQDIWIKTWVKTASLLLHQNDVCVSDMRFCNEAAAVRELGGQVWRVHRPGTAAGEHLSESELDQIVPDKVIRNTGSMEDLTRRVIRELS